MTRTVAELVTDILRATGVKRIYGIVGDSLNGLTDSLRRQGKIEWVHVRHEEVAAFAAGAEAHLTGELAVCAGSLRAGQSAPHQRPVRLPPLARSGAGDRRAHPLGGNRPRLFPGNPSGEAVPGMQPLLRAGLRRRPDAARAGDRDPRGGRQSRRVCRGDPRRRRAAVRRRAIRRQCAACCRRTGRAVPPSASSTALAALLNGQRRVTTLLCGSRLCRRP